MNTIWEVLYQMPWWVYLLLVYLVRVGINASETRVKPVWKLFVLPVIFLAMSVHTVITSFSIDIMVILVWLGSIIVGSIAGWYLISSHDIKVDRQHKLIQLPGSWTTLWLVLTIFAAKCGFGYAAGADPLLVKQTAFEFSMLLVTGICTGLFVGRAACYLHRLQTFTSVDLLPSPPAENAN